VKKIIYLHIGFHRTGTSALQRYLWENRISLSKKGINYPAVGLSGPTHGMLANCLRREPSQDFVRRTKPKTFPGEFNPYAVPSDISANALYESAIADALESPCSITVLSSECFLEEIDPEDVASRLVGPGHDTRIVVYLRRQDSWIQSVINQIVKDRFLRFSGNFADIPQLEQMNYLAILQRWEKAFGRDNLLVRVYEKGQLINDDIVADFLSLLGLPTPRKRKGKAARTENVSLHRDIVGILRETNALNVSPVTHHLLLESLQPLSDALLAEDGESGLELVAPEMCRAIVSHFEGINCEIACRYLGRPDGRLFHAQP
jgi:hypothetical protein